jgi:hypothetical protein
LLHSNPANIINRSIARFGASGGYPQRFADLSDISLPNVRLCSCSGAPHIGFADFRNEQLSPTHNVALNSQTIGTSRFTQRTSPTVEIKRLDDAKLPFAFSSGTLARNLCARIIKWSNRIDLRVANGSISVIALAYAFSLQSKLNGPLFAQKVLSGCRNRD